MWRAAYFTSICNFVRQRSWKWLPVPLPTRHPIYATIVAASLAQCIAVAAKKESTILLKKKASITRPPSGRASLTLFPRNTGDFRLVFCPCFCYLPAVAWHPGFQPLSPPSNLHSPPVQLVPRRTLRGGSAGWWFGSIVSTLTPKAAVVLFIWSTYKPRLSCGLAPFSYPLPLPLSSCPGCIPPLIGLSFLRFYAVASSLFLLFV